MIKTGSDSVDLADPCVILTPVFELHDRVYVFRRHGVPTGTRAGCRNVQRGLTMDKANCRSFQFGLAMDMAGCTTVNVEECSKSQ